MLPNIIAKNEFAAIKKMSAPLAKEKGSANEEEDQIYSKQCLPSLLAPSDAASLIWEQWMLCKILKDKIGRH